jgi:hypothetical protein
MQHKHQWMRGEIEAWAREGLVDSSLAAQLTRRYPDQSGGAGRMLVTGLSVLGALLLGGGIILLLAHNWSDFPRGVRTLLAVSPLVAAQMLAVWGALRGWQGAGWREGLGLFWCLSIGAAIALVSQIYHLSGSYDTFMLTWLVLALPVLYLQRATIAASVYACGVLAWASPQAGDLPRVLAFWPLLMAVWPLMQVGRHHVSSGASFFRWIVTLVTLAGIGISLSRAIPGLWLVAYTAALGALYLADGFGADQARSLWHRPMRIIGGVGCVALALLLSFEWPWREIGWNYWRPAVPEWQGYLDLLLVVLLMGVAVTGVALRRSRLRAADWFPSSFFVVALLAYSLAANPAHHGLAVALCNLFAFAYGVALMAGGLRASSLGSVNAGMLLLGALISLRFFDSDLGLFARGVVFVLLGAFFLAVNLVLARRLRSAT